MVVLKLLVVYFWHMTSKYAFTHIGMSKYPESSNSCPQKSRLPARLMQQQIKHAFLSSERCLHASASVFSPDYANRLMYSTHYTVHTWVKATAPSNTIILFLDPELFIAIHRNRQLAMPNFCERASLCQTFLLLCVWIASQSEHCCFQFWVKV